MAGKDRCWASIRIGFGIRRYLKPELAGAGAGEQQAQRFSAGRRARPAIRASDLRPGKRPAHRRYLPEKQCLTGGAADQPPVRRRGALCDVCFSGMHFVHPCIEIYYSLTLKGFSTNDDFNHQQRPDFSPSAGRAGENASCRLPAMWRKVIRAAKALMASAALIVTTEAGWKYLPCPVIAIKNPPIRLPQLLEDITAHCRNWPGDTRRSRTRIIACNCGKSS